MKVYIVRYNPPGKGRHGGLHDFSQGPFSSRGAAEQALIALSKVGTAGDAMIESYEDHDDDDDDED